MPGAAVIPTKMLWLLENKDLLWVEASGGICQEIGDPSHAYFWRVLQQAVQVRQRADLAAGILLTILKNLLTWTYLDAKLSVLPSESAFELSPDGKMLRTASA